MENKIRSLISRLQEVEAVLGHPEVFNDQKKYRALTQEHAYLSEVKSIWEALNNAQKYIRENKELLSIENEWDYQPQARLTSPSRTD